MNTDVTGTSSVTGLTTSNSSISKEEKQNKIFQNQKDKIKDSVIPLNVNEIITQNTNQQEAVEKETITISTTLGFLEEKEVNNQNNLNKINEEQQEKDSVPETVVVSIHKPPEEPKETFLGKTKRWAGTVWSKMNIKNYFPKQEYIEYKNANGLIMKIPKKKLPLKKKPNIDPTVKKDNNDVRRSSNKMINYASENTIFGAYY